MQEVPKISVSETYREAAQLLNRSANLIDPPAEMGSAPIVRVRTIEQTILDTQWEKEELERKEWRKIEAFKATMGTGESEAFHMLLKAPMDAGISALDANKMAVEAIVHSRNPRNAPDEPRKNMELKISCETDIKASSLESVMDMNIGFDAERAKYQKMWQREEYRAVAPGEGIAAEFMAIARPNAGSEVIDFGAGTGRGALMLAIMGMKVKMLDFANNCLDEDVSNALTTQSHVLTFHEHDLRKPVPYTAEYGYCTDVMEHIEPEHVNEVLGNILRSAQHVFFQISCVDDVCGQLIGEPLHLSVHPYAWWHDLFTKLGCVFHWSKDDGHSCMFYVSSWITGKDMVDVGVLNISLEKIRANVEANLRPQFISSDPDMDENGNETWHDAPEPTFKWKEVSPHPTNDTEVMILGSGPSLGRSLDKIRQLKADGVKIITLNGAYQWCRQNGLLPVNQVVVDARPFNDRFTHPVEPGCNYFIASQCDPSVLDGLPTDRTWLWHTTAESIKDILDEHDGTHWGIPGGSTVLLRAIPLFRMLGFAKFHLFGCDSCCDEDGTHHTTLQPENNNTPFPVLVGGRKFLCHPDQFSQAQEFMDLIKVMGNVIEFEIYGDGLLAWILEHAASLPEIGTATPGASDEFVI